ncbi:Toll/interleukin-1 receptor-like protein [Linum perenne]
MGYKHDVFVSFRGREVRNTFVDHLFKALGENNINPFRDTMHLSLGAHIGEGIQLAIENSRLYVVVLSPAYASSAWCLDELVRMMECAGRRKGSCSASSTVFPIFFNVSTDDIRRCYMDEIRRLRGEYSPEKVIGWIEAIDRVAVIAGSSFNSQHRRESEFVDEFVAKLRKNLSVRKRLTCWTRRIINHFSDLAQANTTARP